MAIFHLSAQAIGRAAGRSSTAAAAYRAGERIEDERTGEIHDYTHKRGVLHSEIVLPGGGTMARAELWNRVEKHHKRGDAVLVRELVVGLPTEIALAARQALAVGFATELANRYGVAADVALHAPRTITDKDIENDPDQYFEIDSITGRRHNGNWHAHIMLSACHVSAAGELGKKAVELDPIHCKRAKIFNMADEQRERWADLVNSALERAGHSVRVDHRTLEAQGVTGRLPGAHLGPVGSGMKHRGEVSEIEGRENAKVRQFVEDMEAAAQAQAQIAETEAQLALAQAAQAAQATQAALKAQEAAQETQKAQDDQERTLRILQAAQAAHRAAQAQAEAAAAEAQELATEAVPAPAAVPAPRTRQVIAAELAPLRATVKRSDEIEAVGSRRIKSARPKVEIEAAKKAAPGLQNRALSARQRAAALTAELEKLPFWMFVRRFQVRQELPNVERLAKALTQEAEALQAVAKADPIEHVAAVIFKSQEAKREALSKIRPLEQELKTIEGREMAEKAQAVEKAAHVKQVQRLQHAARIEAALQQHRESQGLGQDLDRDQEQDRGQGMSM